MDDLIPPTLAAKIGSYHAAGPAWLRDLPKIIGHCATQWELTLLPAYVPGGDSSWTAPVRRPGGELAVLKIIVPMAEPHNPVAALRAWEGRVAVRLFAYDAVLQALLLECCVPGTDAADLLPSEADAIAVRLLPQLWAVEGSTLPDVPSLAVLGAQRATLMQRRAAQYSAVVDVGPLHEAAQLYSHLPTAADRQVLLHGDFHRRNLLSSERGWLAIDPTARAGDPSFDLATHLRGDVGAIARVDRLSYCLGLAPWRTRGWLFALTMQAASWYLSVGDRAGYDASSQAASGLL
jgi:streptomycin 6-kinase